MWGKTEKRESFKEMSPKTKNPCQLRKLAGVHFYIFEKSNLYLQYFFIRSSVFGSPSSFALLKLPQASSVFFNCI